MLSAASISNIPVSEDSRSTLAHRTFKHHALSSGPLKSETNEIKDENLALTQTRYDSPDSLFQKDEKKDVAAYSPVSTGSSTYVQLNSSTSPIRLPSLSFSSAPALPSGKLFTLPPLNGASPRRPHSLLALPNPPSPLPRNEHLTFTQSMPNPYQYSYPVQSNQLYYPMYPAYEHHQYINTPDPRYYQPPPQVINEYRGSIPDTRIREESREKSNDIESSGEDKASDQVPKIINAKDVVATEVQNYDGRVRKMYPCPTPGCNKTFTRRYNLQSHLMVHTGKKPYVCPNCGTSFSRQHDLRRHIRSLHSEERPHHCDHCNLSFARSDALKRHLQSESKREGAGGVHTLSLNM